MTKTKTKKPSKRKPRKRYYTIKEGENKGKKILLTPFMWKNKAIKDKPFVPAENADNILFRASSIAQIMVKPKNKGETIAEGTKTFLRDLWLEKSKNYRRLSSSKYTEKGLENEQEGVETLNRFTDSEYIKNDEVYLQNEWVCGSPDIISDCVLDIKCPYDAKTFHAAVDSKLNKTYYYQLQCYMFLLGLKDAYLCYILTDTPEEIVNDELRRIQWKENILDTSTKEWRKFEKEFRASHRYDKHWEDSEKICIKHFERDEEVIEEFKVRIKECRKYMNENFFKING